MSVVSSGDGGLESHMEDDLQTPLNELFASPEELIKELCEIQHITTERSASIQWAQRLRFLEVPAAEDHSRTWRRSRAKRRKLTKQRTLRLSRPSADRSPETYLAVSYRWLQHDVHSSKEPYLVSKTIRPGYKSTHTSAVDPRILDRAISFAQAHSISHIWIDQECIDQTSPVDKATGVQAMDLVFGNATHVLGLLTTTLFTQAHLDGLAVLLGNYGHLKPDAEAVKGILEVLQLILIDEWWQRAWIFQEEYVAKMHMTLLIPFSAHLQKDADVFGTIDGELCVQASKLRLSATRFFQSLARHGDGSGDRLGVGDGANITVNRLPAALKQYNMLNTLHSPSGRRTHRSSTWDILDDLHHRHCTFAEDKLALAANCLRYPRRLNAPLLAAQHRSLSASLLTLCLTNGELTTTPLLSPATLPSVPLLAFLRHSLFAAFVPPSPKFQTTAMASYRLPSPRLSSRGIEATGWLWRLGPRLRLPSSLGPDLLDADAWNAFLALLVRRGHGGLAKRLEDWFRGRGTGAGADDNEYGVKDDNEDGGHEPSPRERNLEAQFGALRTAFEKRGRIFPARLVGANRDGGAACGLFVGGETAAATRGRLVFTSCPGPGEERDGAVEVFTTVSVGVEVEGEGDGDWYGEEEEDDGGGVVRVRMGEWVNGVWFADEGARRRVVLPWVGGERSGGGKERGRGKERRRRKRSGSGSGSGSSGG